MDLLGCHSDNHVYVCIHLTQERLTRDMAERLEYEGIESVTEGGPFIAYGIVQLSKRIILDVEMDPNVDSIELGEPPSGM